MLFSSIQKMTAPLEARGPARCRIFYHQNDRRAHAHDSHKTRSPHDAQKNPAPRGPRSQREGEPQQKSSEHARRQKAGAIHSRPGSRDPDSEES